MASCSSQMAFNSDLQVAVTTILAAATYLFDSGSNVATAYKYYEYYRQKKEGANVDEIGYSINAGGVFIVVVSLIFVAHISNVIIFCMTLERREHPVGAAYFLPLVHFKRLVQLLGQTCSVAGFKDMTSPEAASLYSILAAALETGPQLIFQYNVLHAVGSFCTSCKLPKVLVMSVIGSLISGAYNGGAAIVPLHRTAKFPARIGIAIAAGMHILCALIVRSFAFTFFVTGSPTAYIVIYASTALGVPCLLFWAFTKPHSTLETSPNACCYQWRRFLHALANGHVSLSLGPLYPLTRDAHRRERQGQSSFHGVLAASTMAHLMLDVGGIILIYKAAFYRPSDGVDNYAPPCTSVSGDLFLPCTLFLVLFSLAVSLYILSILVYLILDKSIHQSNWVVERSLMIMPWMGLVLWRRCSYWWSRQAEHSVDPRPPK